MKKEYARVAEQVDAQDLKSCETKISCRFKSGLRHHLFWRNTQVWLKGPVLKTGRSCKWRRGSNPFSSAINYIAGQSNPVARWAHNPKVIGSNPIPATKWFCGVVVITTACHAVDRGFESHQNRHLASQLSWQSNGLKIRVSLVRFPLEPPLYEIFLVYQGFYFAIMNIQRKIQFHQIEYILTKKIKMMSEELNKNLDILELEKFFVQKNIE